jgi:hypothetical protein
LIYVLNQLINGTGADGLDLRDGRDVCHVRDVRAASDHSLSRATGRVVFCPQQACARLRCPAPASCAAAGPVPDVSDGLRGRASVCFPR